MQEEELELDRICANCNNFFPDTMDYPTEMGICLNDEEFEPFIDQILQGNYACCQKLVDCKKFPGEREVCPEYSEADMSNCIEIDENTEFGREFFSAVQSGQLTREKFQELLAKEQLRNTDFRTMAVEPYSKKLHGNSPKERDTAISTLGALIANKNKAAFELLFEYYQQVPIPKTIEDVHFKKDILAQLDHSEFRVSLIPWITKELYDTPSNNTTRQFISAILRVFERAPQEEVREPLEKMLSDKRFSSRLKKKMKYILSPPANLDW